MTILALLIPLAMLWYAHRMAARVREQASRPPGPVPLSHVRKVPR